MKCTITDPSVLLATHLWKVQALRLLGKRGSHGNSEKSTPHPSITNTVQVRSKCNRVQPKGRAQIGICNGVQKSLEIIGSTPQSHTCPECWQLWPVVGGARNGTAKGDWRWDLNPGGVSFGGFLFGTTRPLGDHVALGVWLGHTALQVPPFCHMDGAGNLNHGLLLLS